MELDVPERPAAGDVGDCSRLAPFDHRQKRSGTLRSGGRENQFVAVDVQRLGHQQLSIEEGGIAGLFELTRRPASAREIAFTPLPGPPAARLRPRRSTRRPARLAQALEDGFELVERQIDAVIGHSALRKIVGADAFGPVT